MFDIHILLIRFLSSVKFTLIYIKRQFPFFYTYSNKGVLLFYYIFFMCLVKTKYEIQCMVF